MYFLKKNRYKLIAKILLFVLFVEPAALLLTVSPVHAQAVTAPNNDANNFNQAFGGYDGISQWGNLDIINNPAISGALKSCLQVVPSFTKKIQKVFGEQGASNSSAIINSGRSTVLSNFCKSGNEAKWAIGSSNGYGNKIDGYFTEAQRLACGDQADKLSGLTDVLSSFENGGGGDVQQVEDEAAAKKLDSIKKDGAKMLAELAITQSESKKTNKILTETKIREECMDSISYSMSKTLLAGVTEGTVNLINTGNFGDSFFIKDSKKYFEDLDKTTLKQVFSGLLDQDGKDSTSYPFLKDTYKNLVSQNVPSEFKDKTKFTLGSFLSKKNSNTSPSQAVSAFKNDFSVGGWDGWLALTQQSQNNPIGFAILSQEEVSRSQSSAKEQVKTELEGGLLSMKKCTEQNVSPTYNEKTGQMEGGGTITRGIEVGPNDPSCVKSEVVTPGSVLASRLDAVITSDVKQLEMADKFNESLNLIFTNAFNTLNTAGLSGLSSKTYGSWASKISKQSFIERYNSTVDGTVEKFNGAVDATKEKYANTIDSTIERYNNTLDGTVVKYNNTTDGTIDTIDTINGIIEKFNVTDKTTEKYTSKVVTTVTANGADVSRVWENSNGVTVNDGKRGFSGLNKKTSAGAELIYHRNESSYSTYDFDITKDLFDQQIGCSTRPGILSSEKKYLLELQRSDNLGTSPLYKLMPAMAELDFCIPGPTTNWEDLADEKYAEMVSSISDNGIGIPTDASVDGGFYSAIGQKIEKLQKDLDNRNAARSVTQATVSAAGIALSELYGVSVVIAAAINAVIEWDRSNDKKKTDQQKTDLSNAAGAINSAMTTAIDKEGREWAELQLVYLKQDYLDYKNAVYDKFSDDNNIPVAKEARPFIGNLPDLAQNLFTIQQSYSEEVKNEKQIVAELEAIAKRVAEINAAATKTAKENGLPTDVPKECRPSTNQCPAVTKYGNLYEIKNDKRAYSAVPVQDKLAIKDLVAYSGSGSNVNGYSTNTNVNTSVDWSKVAYAEGYYPFPKPKVVIIFNADKYNDGSDRYLATLVTYADETSLSVKLSSGIAVFNTGEIYGKYSVFGPFMIKGENIGRTITLTAYSPSYNASERNTEEFYTTLTCKVQASKTDSNHLICDQ